MLSTNTNLLPSNNGSNPLSSENMIIYRNINSGLPISMSGHGPVEEVDHASYTNPNLSTSNPHDLIISRAPVQNPNIPTDTGHNLNVSTVNNHVVYEEGTEEPVYMISDDNIKVNLVSHNTYITDLINTVWHGRERALFTDMAFVCQDGIVPAHSFLLDRLFYFCDIYFRLEEENQLILLPDCTVQQVESAVMEVYNCGTINSFCQLLNFKERSEPPQSYQHLDDHSKYRISVRDIDELLDAKDKQNEAEALKRKMEKDLEEEYIERRPFKCKQCTFRTRNRTLLRAHKLKIHTSNQTNKTSNVPAKKFKTRQRRRENCVMEDDIDTFMEDNISMTFSCQLCRFSSDSTLKLNQHKRQRHEKGERKKHCCAHCDFTTTRIINLKVHTVKEHKDIPKKYSCKECDFATNYLPNIDKHMKKIHLGIPGSFPCSECPKTFFLLSKLKSHQVVHSEEKNFVCDECAAKFKRKDDLKNHMKIHLPDEIRSIEKAKKLTKECPNCGKMFEKNWKLQRHMKVHNKETIVMERAQVPMRWEPIGGVTVMTSTSNNKTLVNTAVNVTTAEATTVVELQDGGLPAVQEYIVLTTTDDKMIGGSGVVSGGGGIVPGDRGIEPADQHHRIIEEEAKYWV